jgi:hypothetical protein
MRLRSAALAIGLVAWWPLVSTGDDGFRAGGSYPLHVELVRVFGELSDDRYARIVERVGRRAVEARGAKPDRFRFTLLDSPELRAFALPGGFAYVTRGLLATFDSEAQLERTLADLLPEAERADPGRTRSSGRRSGGSAGLRRTDRASPSPTWWIARSSARAASTPRSSPRPRAKSAPRSWQSWTVFPSDPIRRTACWSRTGAICTPVWDSGCNFPPAGGCGTDPASWSRARLGETLRSR